MPIAFLLALALASPEAQSQSPRMQQYLRLAEATLRSPIQPGELEAALLSPEGVAAVRGFFERSLEESLVAGGILVTPELGPEAGPDDPAPGPGVEGAFRVDRPSAALRRERLSP